VDEEKMINVRRIFSMVGTEGLSMNAVHRAIERERIPTPGGGKRWDRGFFRVVLLDDAYKPHTYEEVEELVSSEVASRLDPEQLYGIWWYNRLRVRTRQVSEPSENGRRYRKEVRFTVKPKEEWVAVPVSYADIPREVVDAARAAIKDNRVPAKAGRRFWQLSGGIFRCYVCGRALITRSIKARSGKFYHHYYSCPSHHHGGTNACPNRKNCRAAEVEESVWELVSPLLRDPERLRAGLDEMIVAERALMRNLTLEEETWLVRLDALKSKRGRYQEMAAEGLITFDELGAKLRGLKAERDTVEGELENLRLRRPRIEDLERDKETLMQDYAGMVSEELDELAPEQRHQIYRMLRLRVRMQFDDTIEIEGILREAISTPTDRRLGYPRCNPE
jgi:predicted RNA-binding Zn-ribbon protein involved in translation (DUF1610 family)